ncbi:MAG TPA: ATP synthase F1 subunit gamma [Bryobacteraceae bacterium]|nr:ATP synthase F1 subunit gamma [Bryobacteraceae bacterium]HPT29086.1 ATP synthase F1 subunit gamma [Bryobacteraceae bacterium]
MPSLIDIRRRIRSVKNTQQITKAMKMVATARLRKAQERVVNARPYSRMLSEMVANVASAAGAEAFTLHPLLAVREEKRVQLVLVTADRGLAGSFNTNLIKAAQQLLDEHQGKQVAMELCGRKGRDFFRRREINVSGEVTGISQSASYDNAETLADTLIDRFTKGEIDSAYLIYNEFKSVLSQQVAIRRILPLSLPGEQTGGRDYILEQPPAEFMKNLLPSYVEAQVFEAFLESAAAEHAARMTAMDSATTNATEVIAKLTLYMNRVRQATITREIIEVVSGASALE